MNIDTNIEIKDTDKTIVEHFSYQYFSHFLDLICPK